MSGTTPSVKLIATFDAPDGTNPVAGLYMDANGNLLGTAQYTSGITTGDGVVFEVTYSNGTYASTPTVLVSFSGANGANPYAGLIQDSSGNLIGTTQYGGSGNAGTVFEIADNAGTYATTATELYTFTNGDAAGVQPFSSLIADQAGNLFGTTYTGGAGGFGTVFEITKTNGVYATSPTVLATFSGSGGQGGGLWGGLTIDAAGDLFGTTQYGGTNNDGTVFEITKTNGVYASTPTTLVSFNGTDGAKPLSSVIVDAVGNVFGTTSGGGSSNDGTVFEITNSGGTYETTPTTLVNFTGSNGEDPTSALIEDAAGNLFGTTAEGGTSGGGTVFEVVKVGGAYNSTPNTLADFGYGNNNGAQLDGGVIVDAEGNLFGTAANGGSNSDGTVFEITNSGFVTSAACYLHGTHIATPSGPRAVETLAAGEPVLTVSGAARPVVWLGHRRIDIRRHKRPGDVWPVRVCPGAFGPGLPAAELFLSPDHAVFVDFVLIPIRYLINGATIIQEQRDEVTYWHVELERHDVILAEGLPCETYLDTGNRSAFENGGAVVQLHPEFASWRWEAQACAPLTVCGPVLDGVRARLAARVAWWCDARVESPPMTA